MPQTYINLNTPSNSAPVNFVQKVYYNDKAIILTTDKEAYINTHPEAGTYTFFSGATPRSFAQATQLLDRPGNKAVIIEDFSSDALLQQLTATYDQKDAGGGLVTNEKDEVLMIFRRGKWDLPKGKIDPGETMEQCALREVTEETGLQQLQLVHHICDTYHIYMERGDQLLKHSVWYAMKGTSADKLLAQTEEDIMEARWVKPAEIGPLATKAYDAIKDVLLAAGYTW